MLTNQLAADAAEDDATLANVPIRSVEEIQCQHRADQDRRDTWVHANIERVTLREQAWRTHKSNMESEERRYQAELKNIDTVYQLRTGEEA